MDGKFLFYKTTSVSFCLLLFFIYTSAVVAQSLNPAAPAPVRSNDVLGRIAARDLGDARLTDHYYAFTGTPGDLLITIQSRNLNGDLDVFTAAGLRPLLKMTLYAESSAPVTKGIYLRKREDLILRIEARSPNDDEGTYQLRFGGSFEPVAGSPDMVENQETTTNSAIASGSRNTKRVSSVGARLPEPEPTPDIASAKPTPEAEPSPSEAPESPVVVKKEPAPKATASKAPPRTRRPTARRTTTPVKPKVAANTTAENTSPETSSETKTKEEEAPPAVTTPKPRTSARNTTRRTGPTVKPPKPEPATETTPEPESGPRLVIETNDGTLINRSMSSVRRVIVENGQVVVTGKDGKIDRIPLTNVVRMSIAQ